MIFNWVNFFSTILACIWIVIFMFLLMGIKESEYPLTFLAAAILFIAVSVGFVGGF